MFGIETERWFSLFKRGVELLAEMSTFNVLPRVSSVEKRTQFPWALQAGNARRKVPYGRKILIQKARVAGFRGHGVPYNLGRASHTNWARRPTEIGQGVPQKLSHSQWALRPRKTGHDVPVWSAENITQFGDSLVRTFFPHRESISLGRQARAALDWINDSDQWQEYPWYEPILGYFQFFSQGKAANEMPARQHPRGPQCPIFYKAAAATAMVENKYTRSQCATFNKAWCDSHFPITQQPFNASLLQKSGRNEPSMGNNSGIFGRWCHKRNSFAASKTSDPLVCDKIREKSSDLLQLARSSTITWSQNLSGWKIGQNFFLI